MEQQVFPTKGNLMLSKKALQLATLGYDLLDRKRNILIRELMKLVDKAQMLRSSIEGTYSEAYLALQKANISLGVVTPFANTIPIENGVCQLPERYGCRSACGTSGEKAKKGLLRLFKNYLCP